MDLPDPLKHFDQDGPAVRLTVLAMLLCARIALVALVVFL